MKSKVLNKVVFVNEEDEVCMCTTEFRKTCIARIANELQCLETVVRLTPIERVTPSVTCGDALGNETELDKTASEFAKTLTHFGKMR